jgi:hypothetical protein
VQCADYHIEVLSESSLSILMREGRPSNNPE